VRGGVKADVVSLGAGAVVAAIGALIALDSSGAIDLTLGWMAVVLTGAVGAILLLSGLADGGRSRHD
jgi:hypothetical protein